MNTNPTVLALASTLAAHEAAIAVADRAVASLKAEIDALAAGNPTGYAAWRAGRYYWPTMDRLDAACRDAWLESALRASADPGKLGPAADVAHFQRKIAIR